jgi:hypothetical protein
MRLSVAGVLLQLDADHQEGPFADGPASPCSVVDAGCGRLGYAASQLAHLLVGEVVDGEARLLELVTDVPCGQYSVDRRPQFGQRAADEWVIERGRPVLCGLQQPRAERLRLAQGEVESERGLVIDVADGFTGLLDCSIGRLVGGAHGK